MEPVENLLAWKTLGQLADQLQGRSIKSLFAEQPDRFQRYSVEAAGLFLDYSKNRFTNEVIAALVELANQRDLAGARQAMFAGEPINATEGRAVLHTALRSGKSSILVDGDNVMPGIQQLHRQMEQFCGRIESGEWRGYTGETITDVVNIGIGGSDLGPKMVVEALAGSGSAGHPRVHFVSNVDGEHLRRTVAGLQAASTLFIVTSKTFTTAETLMNARSARRWLVGQLGDEAAVANHFVAVSTNLDAAGAFGIAAENCFPMWDWVGGRYSLWSSVGLSIALACGMQGYRQLLAGGQAMDEHFQTAPFSANMPVLLAMIGIWNRNFLNIPSQLLLPYDERLASFPAYLQQCDMESNGKSVDRDGQQVRVATGPLVWGSAGTNSQHAYMQLLHQGTEPVASDFIVALQPAESSPFADHHPTLVANCFAQAEALMNGRTQEEVVESLTVSGMAQADIERLSPHQVQSGNRPSNMLLMDQLTARSLGALIALYEHKVFVQGVIWGINSFDQWGVELGKKLAKRIVSVMAEADGNTSSDSNALDSSTGGLIARYRQAHG